VTDIYCAIRIRPVYLFNTNNITSLRKAPIVTGETVLLSFSHILLNDSLSWRRVELPKSYVKYSNNAGVTVINEGGMIIFLIKKAQYPIFIILLTIDAVNQPNKH